MPKLWGKTTTWQARCLLVPFSLFWSFLQGFCSWVAAMCWLTYLISVVDFCYLIFLIFQLWCLLTEKQIVSFTELKAEASIMDQLSSSDSSSDSKSSSSSSSSSENSSSDSEDEEAKPSLPLSMPYLQPQPTVSAIPQQAVPDKDASHNRSQESSGHMMNTLRKYKGCSFLSTQFQTSRCWKETILFLSMSLL